MCDICGRYICPPACPSYEGRSAELGRRIGICRKCGRSIYKNEEIFSEGSSLVCGDCGRGVPIIFIVPMEKQKGGRA